MKGFRFLLAVTTVLACLALLVAGWALYARFEQTNENRAANQHVWHAVICRIEMAVAKQNLPPAQIREQLRFYDSLLTQDVKTAGCGLIERNP